jgi:hypothetical protein
LHDNYSCIKKGFNIFRISLKKYKNVTNISFSNFYCFTVPFKKFKMTDNTSRYTKIPILTCPDNITVPFPPELTEEQKEKFSELKEYVDSILLPKEDDRYQIEKQWVSDACLKRYLRATKWNLTDAKNKIKYSLEWRREYKPSEIDPKSVEAEVLINNYRIRSI